MAKLVGQRYGKAQVRVLKILRDGPVHTIREIEVSALLAGDFETSYTAGDNSKVVPTDTIKNTVNVFAKQHLADDLERFAVILGEHFVRRYEQVTQATIEVTERGWDRLEVGGKPHLHYFQAASEARRFASPIRTSVASVFEVEHPHMFVLRSPVAARPGLSHCESPTTTHPPAPARGRGKGRAGLHVPQHVELPQARRWLVRGARCHRQIRYRPPACGRGLSHSRADHTPTFPACHRTSSFGADRELAALAMSGRLHNRVMPVIIRPDLARASPFVADVRVILVKAVAATGSTWFHIWNRLHFRYTICVW